MIAFGEISKTTNTLILSLAGILLHIKYVKCIGTKPHPGTSDFAELVNSLYFVDKTKLIKEFIEDNVTALVTAPPGFGKSTNLDMLRRFFEMVVDEDGNPVYSNVDEQGNRLTDNCKLFKDNDLDIYKDREFFYEHCGKYPVIYCNFENVTGTTYEEVLRKFYKVFANVFNQHRYILKSERLNQILKKNFNVIYKELTSETASESRFDALHHLSCYLQGHFNKKVIVLIDNYNEPVYKGLFDTKFEVERSFKFVDRYASSLLKSNGHVHRGIMASNIPAGGWFDYFTETLEDYLFMEKRFSQWFGFTILNIMEMLQRYKLSGRFKTIVNRFEGYGVGDKNRIICSPVSVLMYLKSDSFFDIAKAVGMNRFNEIIQLAQIRETMRRIITGEKEIISTKERYNINDILYMRNVFANPQNYTKIKHIEFRDLKAKHFYENRVCDLFLQILLDLGYFNIVRNRRRCDGQVVATIANSEIGLYLDRLFFTVDHIKKRFDFTSEQIENVLTSFVDLNVESKGSWENFVKSLRKLYAKVRDVILPKSSFDFYNVLVTILRSGKSFDGVFGKLYNKFGDVKKTYVTVVKNDGTVLMVNVYFKTGTSKDALNEIFDSNYHNLLAVEEDEYRRLTKRSTIFIGFHTDSKFKTEISYMINNTDIEKAITITGL